MIQRNRLAPKRAEMLMFIKNNLKLTGGKLICVLSFLAYFEFDFAYFHCLFCFYLISKVLKCEGTSVFSRVGGVLSATCRLSGSL